MTALACLLLAGWIGALAAQQWPAERVPVALAAGCGALFLSFHVLAAIELVSGAPVAGTANAALLLLAVALTLRLVPVHAAAMPPVPHQPWQWMSVVTAGTFALAAVLLVFGRPQGYEVMAYHLPLSVHLLQTHSLMAWDGNFPHTFPANASVLWAALLDALPERLVSAANLLLLVPLAVAVRGLCRLADADGKAAAYACCGLVGVPMIAFSSAELGADVGGIAFAALAMYFVLGTLPLRAAMLLAGLCAGIAFGFKSLHLITAAALFLIACTQGWRAAALFATAALTAGGFWLLRNGIAFGNPLHPVGVPVIGQWLGWGPAAGFDPALRAATQLEWVDRSAQWLTYPWTEPQRYGQNFKHSSGLGAFVAAALPAATVAVGAAIVRDGFARHRVRAALAFGVVFIVAAWWGLGDRQPRYVLGALPLAVPLLAWAVTQAHGRWRRAFDAVLGTCIVAMLAVFLSKEALLFGDRILLSHQTTRAVFYEYPEAVDTLPPRSTILNLADRSWHYPLAGAALANRVISMPAGRRLLGLPPSLTAPQAVTLAPGPLREAGVTHVFVAGATLKVDGCLALDPVAAVDRNPVNGAPLGSARVLYAVRYLCK